MRGPENAKDGWREKNCFGQRRNQIPNREACESMDVRTRGSSPDFQAGTRSGPKGGLLHATPSTPAIAASSGLEGLRVRSQTDDDDAVVART